MELKNFYQQATSDKGEFKRRDSIDCLGIIGAELIRHDLELRMPDRAVCNTRHAMEFIEAESEKEQTCPRRQWDQGHPSHVVSWNSNQEDNSTSNSLVLPIPEVGIRAWCIAEKNAENMLLSPFSPSYPLT